MPILFIHNYTMITWLLQENTVDQTILITSHPPTLNSKLYCMNWSWSTASSLLDYRSNL